MVAPLGLNRTLREKGKWELNKDAAGYSKQIREATPYNTTAVQPLTCNFANHSNKTNKTLWLLLMKQNKLISDVLLSVTGLDTLRQTVFWAHRSGRVCLGSRSRLPEMDPGKPAFMSLAQRLALLEPQWPSMGDTVLRPDPPLQRPCATRVRLVGRSSNN